VDPVIKGSSQLHSLEENGIAWKKSLCSIPKEEIVVRIKSLDISEILLINIKLVFTIHKLVFTEEVKHL
jgi:hypothetical protein